MLETRKKELLPLLEKAVETFLDQHPDLRYYCFALDCNADYAEINLCLNTEEAFARTLQRYQSGPYAESYRDEEAVRSLRYNPGDWEYQCFATFYALEEKELEARYGEDDEALLAEMTAFNRDLLRRLMKTDAFRRIPKTEGFRALCIDHDEDVDDALDRAERDAAS